METGAWEKRCARCFFLPFLSPFANINWMPAALDCSELRPPSRQVFSSVRRMPEARWEEGFASSQSQASREPDCLHLAWLGSRYVSHKPGLSPGLLFLCVMYKKRENNFIRWSQATDDKVGEIISSLLTRSLCYSSPAGDWKQQRAECFNSPSPTAGDLVKRCHRKLKEEKWTKLILYLEEKHIGNFNFLALYLKTDYSLVHVA